MGSLRKFFISIACGLPVLSAQAQQPAIRLNQVGFYSRGPKIAVIENSLGGKFYLVDQSTRDTVFTGISMKSRRSSFSGKPTALAVFTSFTQSGKYYLYVPGAGNSWPFLISDRAGQAVAKGLLKAYYFMRCSEKLLPEYAGKWARAEGHPDTIVYIHPSATGAGRPAGSIISSPGGWYDAGDYNKYIVNSGISTSTLLSAYEDFPAYFDTLRTHIPEDGDQLPDLLNEVLWNLRWMLTMQDPHDGGVYHKLTNAVFAGMIMPGEATAPRYVVQKSTAATLDFAAVMAQAARVFKKFQRRLSGLADSCLSASLRAWQWSLRNPGVIYDQQKMNEAYLPEITTGSYGDPHLQDEWIWAACELYCATREDRFFNAVNVFPDDRMPLPSWNNVRLLGYYSLLRCRRHLTAAANKNISLLQQRLLSSADSLVSKMSRDAYHTVIDESAHNFIWGSNGVAANQGILLLQAYLLTHRRKYIEGAVSNLDYLLGRNATGYSFVTGFGSKTPMHPHHRPSIADGITDPVPGLLVGGPNPGQQDGVNTYPSRIPDESYVDDHRAYACNEIAINWNAPAVYLANALEALFQSGFSVTGPMSPEGTGSHPDASKGR